MAIDPVFAAAAGVSVVAGIAMVTRRNPVYSAIMMLVCFLALAVVYLKLDAPFLAAMHVLVYTGAILVLFLFVIMLLNLKPEEMGAELPLPARGLIALLCAGMFGLVVLVLMSDPSIHEPLPKMDPRLLADFGGIERTGHSLFNEYGLPFELISVLILVAIFGGVVLAKKKL
jgi:NADH-quinone oxidoreductase subunit J